MNDYVRICILTMRHYIALHDNMCGILFGYWLAVPIVRYSCCWMMEQYEWRMLCSCKSDVCIWNVWTRPRSVLKQIDVWPSNLFFELCVAMTYKSIINDNSLFFFIFWILFIFVTCLSVQLIFLFVLILFILSHVVCVSMRGLFIRAWFV